MNQYVKDLTYKNVNGCQKNNVTFSFKRKSSSYSPQQIQTGAPTKTKIQFIYSLLLKPALNGPVPFLIHYESPGFADPVQFSPSIPTDGLGLSFAVEIVKTSPPFSHHCHTHYCTYSHTVADWV